MGREIVVEFLIPDKRLSRNPAVTTGNGVEGVIRLRR